MFKLNSKPDTAVLYVAAAQRAVNDHLTNTNRKLFMCEIG